MEGVKEAVSIEHHGRRLSGSLLGGTKIKLVHGVIRTGENAGPTIVGGDHCGPVSIIDYRGLGCVVSDFADQAISSMPKEKVVRCLLAHQMVLEQVMNESAVLPVKFGTVLPTDDDVRDLLAQGHVRFADVLAWVQDKVQVEVAATWDKTQVLEAIASEEGIRRAVEAISHNGGQPALEDRVRLGQLVKGSMDARRDDYKERIISFLGPVAADVQPNALVSDEIVMSVAFLLEMVRQREFDERVGQLDDLFHNQIEFRIIGPLPPYTFATVEIGRIDRERIAEASGFLQLGESISEQEVKRAYRRLAADAHPDRHPGDDLAKARFIKLREAADLLIAQCRGQGGSGGGFLINVRRVRDQDVQHVHFGELARA